jgi:lipopolysaccharide biosynthesis glycosyltransferase
MNSSVIKVFIGFDPVESVAWHTMTHSIFSQSSQPVAIIPVNLANLRGIFTRERHPKQSNEFSFTRFLVPYLSNYEGYALFFDCDMLLRGDISEIFNAIKDAPDKAVYVVKHDYQPRDDIKYLGTVQYKYPRKNWSSVVLWNCGHPSNRQVTPDLVNSAKPMFLHRFNWLTDEEIGDLDVRWNWLVGEYDKPPEDVKNVHWTVGGPYFNEYHHTDFADEWFTAMQRMSYCKQRDYK